MDKEIIITDRQIGHIREEISRVIRQIKLIKIGDTHSGNINRIDIAVVCCKEIDSILSEL